jgi:peptidoglycan/LPS O-acetylase OafA/YrhL
VGDEVTIAAEKPVVRRRSRREASHWRGLDGLRAIAVVAVVTYHFSPGTLPGGFLGVDIFFVISGYLITRLIAVEFLAAGRINLGRFYVRRARRLLPALAVVLAVVSAAALIWRDQLATIRGAVLSTAVFGGNWWLAFDHQPYFVSTGRPSLLQHLWSLGVEEQFYLVWPLIAAAILASSRRASLRKADSADDSALSTSLVRRGQAVGRLCGVALAMALGSTALTWVLADRGNVPYGNDGSTLYYGTDTHCMGLLLGAALGAWAASGDIQAGGSGKAVVAASGERAGWRTICWDTAGAVATIVLLWFALAMTEFSHLLFRGGFLLLSATVCVVIAAATRPGSRLGVALDWGPMTWIGVRSYSIYLWHWPVAMVTRPGLDTTMPLWLDQTLRILLTVVLAAVTYESVETPVRRLGFRVAAATLAARVRAGWRRMPPRAGVLVSVGAAVVVLAGLFVIVIGPAAPVPVAAAGAGVGSKHISLPAPPVTNEPTVVSHRLPKVSVFGDSVILGARRQIGHAFSGGTMDAIEGRQPDPILADARGAAHAGTLNPVVILHVGDNGLIDPTQLAETLQALRHQRLVLVLTDHIDPFDHSWQDPNNNTIKNIVPSFANARVVDWNHVASQHHHWLYPDDLHLRPAGTVGFAQMLADAYRQWYADQ